METRDPFRIRDTSAQDHAIKPAASTRRRIPRNWLVGGIAGIAVLALAAWVASGWMSGARSFDGSRVRVAEVTRGDLVRDITADGRVIAANSPTLYAIAGGTVALKVVAGDVVKKGQALAEIDSPELRSKLAQEGSTLASMEAEASRAVLDAQIARSTASKVLDQAQIERIAAERDLERYQRAYEGGAVSQNEYAKAQDELKKAQIGLAAAHKDAGLQGQGAGLDSRNKRLLADRQRAVVVELQRQVDALTLRAPFDGQIGQVQIPQGTNVASNGTQYAAEVSAVSPEVVNGEVNARLRFAQGKQPPGLRQNQRLSARIVLDTRRNVLMVERGSFLEQGGGRFAYVVDGSRAVRRPIQTGASSLSAVEIVSGLQPGEKIVVSGSDQFGDAERVSIH